MRESNLNERTVTRNVQALIENEPETDEEEPPTVKASGSDHSSHVTGRVINGVTVVDDPNRLLPNFGMGLPFFYPHGIGDNVALVRFL